MTVSSDHAPAPVEDEAPTEPAEAAPADGVSEAGDRQGFFVCEWVIRVHIFVEFLETGAYWD